MPKTPRQITLKPRSHHIPGILDTHVFDGTDADSSAPAELLIEVPHGATKSEDFHSLADKLDGPHPPDLCDFFHVNTDVGAFEVAAATARRFVEAHPTRRAKVLRCRIPRTFIDCNRRIDLSKDAFKEGGVTPGLMPWVQAPGDMALLRERYEAYISTVTSAREELPDNGAVVILHTYAPRTVDVDVDENIVDSLRHAYEPDVFETWPLRPEFDVICHDLDGNDHGPRHVIDALRGELGKLGWPLEESATYPLHPSTLAWDHVVALPGRALCVEVRRDLLADPFDPFHEMNVCPQKVEPIAGALARSLSPWMTG